MTHITLALPFALPPPEMAPDLLRVLDTPALATLLSRHSQLQYATYDNNSRVLPHEAWLAHALGLAPSPASPDAAAPLATTAMRGCGLHADASADADADANADAATPAGGDQGYWFIVQPSHIQLSRTHLLLSEPRSLQLTEAESRTLYELARPCFEELGQTLLHGAPGLWFLRADAWSGLTTASPDAATTQNLSDWMPEGEQARAFRKLQNEIQMLWHEHPALEERQSRGLLAVNSLWLWGGAPTSATSASAASATAKAAATNIAIGGGPAWMEALVPAGQRQPTADQLIAQPGIAMLAELIPSAQAGDWSDWLARMQRLEQEWFAPLLAALKDGRISRVTLVLSHRHGWTTASTSTLALNKFWRKPNLQHLLKQA